MSQLGVGVMIGMLSGNEETVNAVKSSLNKIIERAYLDDANNQLVIKLTDGTKLRLWDDGQSCCEHRYMATSDDLSEYDGAKLLNIELKDGPPEVDEYGDHEIQFLEALTDRGVFQIVNHNEHNGYYGGFLINASLS